MAWGDSVPTAAAAAPAPPRRGVALAAARALLAEDAPEDEDLLTHTDKVGRCWLTAGGPRIDCAWCHRLNSIYAFGKEWLKALV